MSDVYRGLFHVSVWKKDVYLEKWKSQKKKKSDWVVIHTSCGTFVRRHLQLQRAAGRGWRNLQCRSTLICLHRYYCGICAGVARAFSCKDWSRLTTEGPLSCDISLLDVKQLCTACTPCQTRPCASSAVSGVASAEQNYRYTMMKETELNVLPCRRYTIFRKWQDSPVAFSYFLHTISRSSVWYWASFI